MIEGLSHITLIVRDLDSMGQIPEQVLGAKEVYRSGDKQFSLSPERFYLVGEIWVAVMVGEVLAERTYNHIASKVPDDALDGYLVRIEALGLDVKPSRSRVEGEGRSIYFYDHDNHLFELHSGRLDERLARYAREVAA
ncbi:FosX/FosE/FosI family fosfomycin resistance hydrolase [Agrobacterium sp. ES01]|uniref:FosX/FosE/FosI family fosfomycin resistance hydrolase n=1 Tax=Agrobacterium sp. ES01 TaxID=3420714 RepID=UPI003D098850